MIKLPEEVLEFLEKQHFVVVVTGDKDGSFHASCKGIVDIKKSGKLVLLDVYKGKTYANLKRHRKITVTAVDEHKFKGVCLKGTARIANISGFRKNVADIWERKITSRIAHRILSNVRQQKSQKMFPESRLPQPEYVIVMQAREVIDLTPGHLL